MTFHFVVFNIPRLNNKFAWKRCAGRGGGGRGCTLWSIAKIVRDISPANTRLWANVVLKLTRRLRRQPNLKTSLAQGLMVASLSVMPIFRPAAGCPVRTTLILFVLSQCMTDLPCMTASPCMADSPQRPNRGEKARALKENDYVPEGSELHFVSHPYNTDIFLYNPWRPTFLLFQIIINVWVSSFCFIWIHILRVYDHYKYFNYFSAGIDSIRQNLTSGDRRLKSIPALKGLITKQGLFKSPQVRIKEWINGGVGHLCAYIYWRGFVNLKKIQKSVKNSEVGGWVGHVPTRIIFFFGNCVFFCFFVFFFVCTWLKKKWIGGMGEWDLANPSFSRIFWFFLTWQDP